MHSSMVHTSTLPRSSPAPWLSNKRLCLRACSSSGRSGVIVCSAVPNHETAKSQRHSARRSTSQISAAADTVAKPAAQAPHTNVAPGQHAKSDCEQQAFDWHDQWYAVGYERCELHSVAHVYGHCCCSDNLLPSAAVDTLAGKALHEHYSNTGVRMQRL